MGRTYTPQLTIDEVMLLVDTYFQLKDVSEPMQRKTMIQDLSNSMRALPFFPSYKNEPTFRSYAGMQLCLARVGCADPDNKSNFAKGTAMQTKVFNYYSNKRELLHSVANAIKETSRLDFPLLEKYRESFAGALPASYHEHVERNNKVIENAKKIALTQGRCSCAVCGLNIEVVYPGHVEDLLEAHIALPIGKMNGREDVSLSDVLFLCPTCHVLAHSSPEMYEEQNLRKAVKIR